MRVYLDFSDSRVRDNATINYKVGNTDKQGTWAQFLADFPNDSTQTDWKYVPDSDATLGGYFYYTKILTPGETTPSLIEGVKTTFPNTDSIRDFDIVVYSESVQTSEIDSAGTKYQDGDWRIAWTIFLNPNQS